MSNEQSCHEDSFSLLMKERMPSLVITFHRYALRFGRQPSISTPYNDTASSALWNGFNKSLIASTCQTVALISHCQVRPHFFHSLLDPPPILHLIWVIHHILSNSDSGSEFLLMPSGEFLYTGLAQPFRDRAFLAHHRIHCWTTG